MGLGRIPLWKSRHAHGLSSATPHLICSSSYCVYFILNTSSNLEGTCTKHSKSPIKFLIFAEFKYFMSFEICGGLLTFWSFKTPSACSPHLHVRSRRSAILWEDRAVTFHAIVLRSFRELSVHGRQFCMPFSHTEFLRSSTPIKGASFSQFSNEKNTKSSYLQKFSLHALSLFRSFCWLGWGRSWSASVRERAIDGRWSAWLPNCTLKEGVRLRSSHEKRPESSLG